MMNPDASEALDRLADAERRLLEARMEYLQRLREVRGNLMHEVDEMPLPALLRPQAT
jgi:hypothetical protein